MLNAIKKRLSQKRTEKIPVSGPLRTAPEYPTGHEVWKSTCTKCGFVSHGPLILNGCVNCGPCVSHDFERLPNPGEL